MPTRPSLAILCATLTVLAATVVTARAQTTTVLYVDSKPGDVVGAGEIRTLTAADATFTVTRSGRTIRVRVQTPIFSDWWTLEFAAPGDQPALAVGTYAPAFRSPFNEQFAGLSMSGGTGCNTLTGRFQILELTFGSDETVQSLAVDAEQHCNDATPALFAALRYNSAIASTTPFGGSYPRYELHVAPPVNGTVSATGILCGGGNADCSENLGAAATLELTASPDSGFVFMGWGGGCRGGATTPVKVNSIVSCTAAFAPEVPTLPRSFLSVYSHPSDFIGRGRQEIFTPENSRWTRFFRDFGGLEVFSIAGMGEGETARWGIELGIPGGGRLVPGEYGPTTSMVHPLYPYLWISEGSNCTAGGRLTVYEAEYDASGELVRLAVDIEQHCGPEPSGMFFALRFNSTLPGVIPFGSIPPGYRLTITPTTGGRVTGGGIDCRNGGPTCSAQFVASTEVTLIATPDVGYIFAGWTGFCFGGATTTVRVNSIKECGALFQQRTPATPRTLLFIDDRRGSTPQTHSLTPATATIFVERIQPNAIAVGVQTIDRRWDMRISVPSPGPMTPGIYAPARRYPFTPFYGLSIGPCNQLTGRFIVHEVEYGTDGSVVRLAADLEEHCENVTPAIFVAIRYNSTFQPVPFFGVYPWYEMTLTPPTGGAIRGGPLNCGGGQADCWVTFLEASPLTLTAVPDPGYVFTGWSGACSGGQTITVNVNTAMACTAKFELEPSATPRTVFYWESLRGDWIGAGQHEVFSSNNSTWTLFMTQADRRLELQINTVNEISDSRWTLWFSAAEGFKLAPGTYVGGAPFQASPSLWIGGDGRTCDSVSTFTVHELMRNPTGAVTSMAIDFEQRCGNASNPPLFGTIRYNSTFPVPIRGVSLDADKTFPLKFGTTIQWTASAHPGVGVEYSFWRQAPNGPWTLVQPYSTSAVHAWTPTAADLGTHSFQVWARRVGSSEPYEAYSAKSFVVDAGPVPTVSSLIANKAPQVGVAVTWTATATGGIGPLQYQFWRLDSSGWVMARAYSSSNTYTWTATAPDVGPHALQVWVRNAGSTTVYDAYRAISFDVPAPPPVSANSLTANIAFPAAVGTPITWTAGASGGTAPLQYQFWRLDAGGWTIVQAYSSSSTYTWTPALADAGEHALQVWVRSAGSTATYDAWRGLNFALTGLPPVTLTSLTTASAQPLPAGSAHTWTAVASGGVAPLQYQFWRRDADGWKMVRDWATSSSYTWTPTAGDLGSHDLQVWVRSAGTTTGFDAWRSAPSFEVMAPAITLRLVVNATFPLSSGIEVEWGAIASGGVAPLEYKFYRLDADGWKMVQDYSPNAVYRWIPTAADAGTHAIQVWVRSPGSTNVYDAWTGSGLFVINP